MTSWESQSLQCTLNIQLKVFTHERRNVCWSAWSQVFKLLIQLYTFFPLFYLYYDCPQWTPAPPPHHPPSQATLCWQGQKRTNRASSEQMRHSLGPRDVGRTRLVMVLGVVWTRRRLALLRPCPHVMACRRCNLTCNTQLSHCTGLLCINSKVILTHIFSGAAVHVHVNGYW